MPDASGVYDLLIIGGGPAGLACGIAAGQAGARYLILEKAALAETIRRMPRQMTFFSSAENLEIAGVPFPSNYFRPSRVEVLNYYRKLARHFAVQIRQYEPVEHVERRPDGTYRVATRLRGGGEASYLGRAVVVATGYFDNPNRLGVPGEDLPHVSHYYDEPFGYYNQDVVVVGGANSAVEAALELYRHDARVTLVHRGARLSENVKPWILPDIEARLRKGEIPAYFETVVERIEPGWVHLARRDGERFTTRADHVLLLTGYRPDHSLLCSLGVQTDPVTGVPCHDPATLETNVPGLYVAGVVAAGYDANKIFIENSRDHGPKILAHLTGRRDGTAGG